MAIECAANGRNKSGDSEAPHGLSYFLSKLLIDTLLFGALSAVLSSPLPLLIGAILYVSNDAVWLLGKTGIRIVPDSFGANFIGAAVFLSASWFVLTSYKTSLPVWLSAQLPANFSWAGVGIGALGCAVLAGLTTAVSRLLPRIGLNVRPDSVAGATARGLIGFAILGLVYLALSSPSVQAWFVGP